MPDAFPADQPHTVGRSMREERSAFDRRRIRIPVDALDNRAKLTPIRLEAA
jgi:hypothetical protein